MALGQILNKNTEKPDFQILRDLLEFPVVVEIRLNVETLDDEKTKSHIKSRKLFQDFVKGNVGGKNAIFNNYYSKDVWEVQKAAIINTDDIRLSGRLRKSHARKPIKPLTKSQNDNVNMVKLCTLSDYIELLLPLLEK